jgi:hypothetical protein
MREYLGYKELKVPIRERNNPSDKKLENLYPRLKWRTNENE